MKHKLLATVASLLFLTRLKADEPATEFFAIETQKLARLAVTDKALDDLPSSKLADISMAHGSYGGGGTFKFESATFRIDARFGGHADHSDHGPTSISYNLSAGKDPTGWSLLSVQGNAAKQGKQYITETWRKKPVTVVLRVLNLKR